MHTTTTITLHPATYTLSCGVRVDFLASRTVRLNMAGETTTDTDTSYQLTAPDASAIAFVAVADGEPLPAELTDDDISPATARSAGALKRAWRELVGSQPQPPTQQKE